MVDLLDIEAPGADEAELVDAFDALIGMDFGWPAGAFRSSLFMVGLAGGAPSVNAIETAIPFYVPRRTIVVSLGIGLTTAQAGAEARVGLYTNANGLPDQLIVDAGIIDLSTGSATVRETGAISIELPPGIIWTVCQLKNVATQATVVRSGQMAPIITPTATLFLGGNNPRYMGRSITYGSALLSTASGSLAAAAGTDAPAILLKAAP